MRDPGRTVAVAAILAGILLLGPAGSSRAGAQAILQEDEVGETRLLRAAASREAAGDLAGAERILRAVLRENPASGRALVALERVLRERGRTRAFLPVVERFLEADPASTLGHYLELVALADLGEAEGLREAARAWIDGRPDDPEPYRQIARIYADALGPEDALGVLERGSRALGRPDAFAGERGRILARAGRTEEAARAWADAVGEAGWSAGKASRRLGEIPGDPTPLAREMVARLTKEPTTPGRRSTAAFLSAAVGDGERARELAGRLVNELSDDALPEFLVGLARRAEGGGLGRLVLWSYLRLREHRGGDGNAAVALDRRIAAAALEVADSARAREAYHRIAGALSEGSGERRHARAMEIRLGVGRASPEELARALEEFREEFAGAPEADELAGRVAHALHRSGDRKGARRILEGAEGARARLETGYLALAGGDLETALPALRSGAGSIAPTEATAVLEWIRLVERIEGEPGGHVARAAVAAHQGDLPGSLEAIGAALEGARGDARVPLLATGARVAEAAGRPDAARRYRREVASEHPDAPEAPDVILELARSLAAEPGTGEEAAALLERLILDHPESAVVPQARRSLERIRERVPRS